MKMFLCCALALLLFHTVQAATYTLHTVHSGSVSSSIRIINLSDTYGVIEIAGFDDQGEEYGPVELDIEAHASVVLLTRELENGAPDKGLMDGLGDRSGQWQLQLTTELQIAAVSFKSGVLSDVLSSAEEAGGSLSEHFMWAHKLVDKGVSRTYLLGTSQGQRPHELLSAYSWTPLDEVDGVIIGEGDYESSQTLDRWKRLGGRLEYSFSPSTTACWTARRAAKPIPSGARRTAKGRPMASPSTRARRCLCQSKGSSVMGWSRSKWTPTRRLCLV